MSETQRVAIVTGATGGIGRAMMLGLLSAGIRVAGVDRDRERLGVLDDLRGRTTMGIDTGVEASASTARFA